MAIGSRASPLTRATQPSIFEPVQTMSASATAKAVSPAQPFQNSSVAFFRANARPVELSGSGDAGSSSSLRP
jgi:hypothetical protein